jgi:phosphopantothenoylcysteine synthetase/decarboxylase
LRRRPKQLENGRAKLLRKGVDAIVVNDVSREGVGFDSDLNGATFLTATTAHRFAGDVEAQAGRSHSG